MGIQTDKMAVVDSHARVYGVKGVRVVDASAFPFLPPGHPQSTVCKFPLVPMNNPKSILISFDRRTCGEDCRLYQSRTVTQSTAGKLVMCKKICNLKTLFCKYVFECKYCML